MTIDLQTLHQMGLLPERCVDCDSRRCGGECRQFPSAVSIVGKEQARAIAWDGRLGTVDAGDLGLKAGHFPMRLMVISPRTGHALTFDQTGQSIKDGDVQSVSYAAAGDGLGCWIEVFND
jgi:hypothetical protein